MLRLKKYHLAMLIAFSMMLVFSSCSKDADDSPDASSWTIVGNWTLDGIAFDTDKDGKITDEERMKMPDESKMELTFKDDGTGHQWARDEDGEEEYDFTWELMGNNSLIAITYKDEDDLGLARIYVISANEMGLQAVEENEESLIIVLKK